MNSLARKVCLVLTLCASTMAHSWSFPFGSAAGLSISSFSWLSKPAWFSGVRESVATKCDLVGSSVVSGLNTADEKLHSAHDKVSQALDPQAPPMLNAHQVLLGGLVVWATAHLFYKGWVCSEKKKQEDIINHKSIIIDGQKVVIKQNENSITTFNVEKETEIYWVSYWSRTKGYNQGFMEGKKVSDAELQNANQEEKEAARKILLENERKQSLFQQRNRKLQSERNRVLLQNKNLKDKIKSVKKNNKTTVSELTEDLSRQALQLVEFEKEVAKLNEEAVNLNKEFLAIESQRGLRRRSQTPVSRRVSSSVALTSSSSNQAKA